ncbi:hypothetical protein F5Y11DRAFT_344733 [Daldinia sp. FL1419]|nr:hypothetical protein F5Y11DRAFT_344733 [Daldinia sp. FL1419]
MAPATKSSGSMPFIVSTSTKKPDPEMRKFIRSHVMMGKNRGKILRPKYNQAGGWSNHQSSHNSRSRPGPEEEYDEDSPIILTPVTVPQRVGGDLSFVRFADTIEDSRVSVILEFSSIAKKVLFPLEPYIAFAAREKSGWMEALTIDAAYLHALAFSTQAYFDLLSGRTLSRGSTSAYPHMLKALRLLRERLDAEQDVAVKSSFSTAAVVLCLAFHAHITGEHGTARHHMLGLRKIVDLRGGLTGLGNTKLVIELLRCDMGMALNNGTKPIFFSDLVQEPYWPYPDFTQYNITPNPEDEPFPTLDTELAIVWCNMKQFCALVNHTAAAGHKLSEEILLDSMASVMYRLLHTCFARGSLSEVVRLGLLAFCSSVFLQWTSVRLPYTYFPAVYRDNLMNLEFLIADCDYTNTDSFSVPRLLVWLLMVGAVSAFDGPDSETWLKPWLRVNLELCDIDSWSTMRAVLDSFMWIGLVQDTLTRSIFESAMSSRLYLGFG